MSTPGGHTEGEAGAQVEGSIARNAEEEVLFQQFLKEQAAKKAAEEQRRRAEEERQAQERAAAQRAEEERAAQEVARLAAAVAAERAEFAHVSLGSARVLLLESTLPAKDAVEFALPAAPTEYELSQGDIAEVYPVPAEFEASRPPEVAEPYKSDSDILKQVSNDSDELLQLAWREARSAKNHRAVEPWFKANEAIVSELLKKYPPPFRSSMNEHQGYYDYQEHWKKLAGLDPEGLAKTKESPENQRIRAENQARREKAMAEWVQRCAKVTEDNRRGPSVSATLLAFALSLGFQTDVSSRAPTWMLVRTAAGELTEEQQHQLRKAIGTALKYPHIKHCSCA